MRFSIRSLMISALAVSGAGFASLPTSANAQDGSQFLGDIRWVAFNFTPRGWAPCDGRLLDISQNQALFSLYGTMYGGDGRRTFGLPDMRGRAPMHTGTGPGLSNRRQGSRSGIEDATLNVNTLPSHTHVGSGEAIIRATSLPGNSNAPAGKVLANDGRDRVYRDAAPDVEMASDAISFDATVGNNGNNVAFSVEDPSLVVNCIVAITGRFPSRN